MRRAAARRPPRPGSLAATGMAEPGGNELDNLLGWSPQRNPRARPLLGRGAPAVRGAAADRVAGAGDRVLAAGVCGREGKPLEGREGRDQRMRGRAGPPGPEPNPYETLELRKHARLERLEAAARGLQVSVQRRCTPLELSGDANPAGLDDGSSPLLLSRASVSQVRDLGVVSRALQAAAEGGMQGVPRHSVPRGVPAEASSSVALRSGMDEPAQGGHEQTRRVPGVAAGLRHRAARHAVGQAGLACGFRSE